MEVTDGSLHLPVKDRYKREDRREKRRNWLEISAKEKEPNNPTHEKKRKYKVVNNSGEYEYLGLSVKEQLVRYPINALPDGKSELFQFACALAFEAKILHV